MRALCDPTTNGFSPQGVAAVLDLARQCARQRAQPGWVPFEVGGEDVHSVGALPAPGTGYSKGRALASVLHSLPPLAVPPRALAAHMAAVAPPQAPGHAAPAPPGPQPRGLAAIAGDLFAVLRSAQGGAIVAATEAAQQVEFNGVPQAGEDEEPQPVEDGGPAAAEEPPLSLLVTSHFTSSPESSILADQSRRRGIPDGAFTRVAAAAAAGFQAPPPTSEPHVAVSGAAGGDAALGHPAEDAPVVPAPVAAPASQPPLQHGSALQRSAFCSRLGPEASIPGAIEPEAPQGSDELQAASEASFFLPTPPPTRQSGAVPGGSTAAGFAEPGPSSTVASGGPAGMQVQRPGAVGAAAGTSAHGLAGACQREPRPGRAPHDVAGASTRVTAGVFAEAMVQQPMYLQPSTQVWCLVRMRSAHRCVSLTVLAPRAQYGLGHCYPQNCSVLRCPATRCMLVRAC